MVHEDSENVSSDPELSELEILEQKLRKRKKSRVETANGAKRKRIVVISDSDESE